MSKVRRGGRKRKLNRIQFTLRLFAPLRDAVLAAAKGEGRADMNEYLNVLIRDGLKAHGHAAPERLFELAD